MKENKYKLRDVEILKNVILDDTSILKKSFYGRDTSIVAKELLGKLLIKKLNVPVCGGIILETEAYYGQDDPASHAFRGITPRSNIMFGSPGLAYIYLCYGMHCLLNVVTEKQGIPGAVLIRVLQPVIGVEVMMERRKINDDLNLTNGPGKLTAALGIDIKDNGKDLTKINSGIGIFDTDIIFAETEIMISPRVGITNGKDRLLRYYFKNNSLK
jgi:DNA-3-methyladenine glycosylase